MWTVLKFIYIGGPTMACVAALEVGVFYVVCIVVEPLVSKQPPTYDCMSSGWAVIVPLVMAVVAGIGGALIGAVAFGLAGALCWKRSDVNYLLS